MQRLSIGPRLRKRVPELDRIVEEPAAEMDAGKPRDPDKVVPEHFVPEVLDLGDFGEEAVAADVVTIAAMLLSPRDPAHPDAIFPARAGEMPRLTSSYAAVRPAGPAPMMMTACSDWDRMVKPDSHSRIGSFRFRSKISDHNEPDLDRSWRPTAPRGPLTTGFRSDGSPRRR